MTFQQPGQAPGFGAAPAALGRQAEFADDMAPRCANARAIAGSVVVLLLWRLVDRVITRRR